MSRMHRVVDRNRTNLEAAIAAKKGLTYYREKAEFTGDYLLKVGERTITASKFVIATGARSLVPPIPGLEETGYLDHVSLLSLETLRPRA